MELGHLYGPGHRPFNRYAAKPESKPSRRTKEADKRSAEVRRKREDVEMAKALGITVQELWA